MAKRLRSWNKNKFEQCLSIGKGLGEGSDYKPWITVQDFSSKGIVSRVYSHKTGRVHHFLSRNELYYFYILEWSDKVLDIREQYPLLDIELAMDIAKESGIKYPRDKQSNFPYVLTCDFMITTNTGLKARTIKNTEDLKNKRTLEKLEIERRYLEKFGVDWGVVTEKDIPMQRAKEIEWLHSSSELPAHLNKEEYIDAVSKIVKDESIFIALKTFEQEYCLLNGSGILLLKHLIWNRMLNYDVSKIMIT